MQRRFRIGSKALAIAALLCSACVHIEQSGDTTAAKNDSAAPAAASTSPDSVPTDSIAKENWVFAGVTADIASAIHDVARKHNFDLDSMPQGWLEPKYIADAGKRPDVGEYFKRYSSYAADLDTRFDSIVDSVTTRRFRMAGFAPKDEKELRAAFDRGLAKTKATQRDMIAAMKQQAATALRLHEYLVRVDARIELSKKDSTLLFDRPAEYDRYLKLATEADSANAVAARVFEAARTSNASLRKSGG
jgi:hypothetical protein